MKVTIEILQTPEGRKLGELLDAQVAMYASPVGWGTTERKNGVEEIDSYDLISVDLRRNPVFDRQLRLEGSVDVRGNLKFAWAEEED